MVIISEYDFIIKKTRRGWIIARKEEIEGKKNHSHFKTDKGCHMLLDMLIHGLKPTSKYFDKAAERILTDEEYQSLREIRRKERYINKRS